MKGRPVEQLVYEHMIPRPKSSDPHNFHGILTRHLVYEVRHEVHTFYGHLETQEAKYPGLDYTHPIHRVRLSRLPWHRRLFRAFDALGLTPSEIASLTKWEGTKWAKERYEKEQDIKIHDTAADGFPDYRMPNSRHRHSRRHTLLPEGTGELQDKSALSPLTSQSEPRTLHSTLRNQDMYDVDMDVGDMESNDEISSVGLELNERLRQRVAAHNAGDTSQPIDETFEQYIVNLRNSGQLDALISQMSRMSPTPQSHNAICQLLIEAARGMSTDSQAQSGDSTLMAVHAGGVSHSTGLDANQPTSTTSTRSSTAATAASGRSSSRHQSQSHSWHRSYSDLRLPTSEATH